LIGLKEILGQCPGDILSVSWRYLIGGMEIFDQWRGGIRSVCWR